MEPDAATEFELGRDGPHTVVVGVDGSVTSERAASYAAGVARREQSRLVVVFARYLGANTSAVAPGMGAAAVESLDAVEQHIRDRIAARPWSVRVELVIRAGTPLKVLTDVADEVRAGLLVVGSSRPHAYYRPGGPLPVQLMRLRRWPVTVVP
ncbi:universal stress protein [Nocardioides sp. C4-1]|uniref:universal stress protein n=1 Tax=Nocardioides sp. C4-1 TaxID=3151851 RepID=UPI003265807E